MSKQNSLFLKELSKNYKEYNKQISVSQKSEIPEMLAYEVQEKTLNILANISELITKRHAHHEWRQVENDFSQALSRLAQKNENIHTELQKLGIDGANVPTMADLLEKLSNTIGEILDKNTNFIVDIYRKHSSNPAENLANGNGEGMEEKSAAPKYKKLINMLIEQGIDVKNLSITTEKLDENRMRKYPYKIVHILGSNPKTITISDELGQATYVFDGYISLLDFINAEKWEAIDGITPQKVIYNEDTFESRLFEVIFGNNIPKIQNTKTENISKNTEDNATPDIIRYQSQLLGIMDELKKKGLIENNGKYYFHELGWVKSWPKIAGRNLRSFPSAEFNRKNNVVDEENETWTMNNSKELSKLFEVLGFEVANEEDEKEFFKNQIIEIIPELKEKGLIEINGKYYFHELKWIDSWPKIAGKKLKSFPNTEFNKKNNVLDEENKAWTMSNRKELAELFKVLGFDVATEEDEKELFKNQVIEIIPELKEIGLIEINGKYYFHELKWVDCWPKIAGKKLQSFPNAEFNKKNNVLDEENKTWTMRNRKELAKLFKVLGFDVEIPE